MSHNGERRLLSTIKETIEICSHVVPGQEDEELIKQHVGPDTNHSITTPPSFSDELQQCASSAPNQGAPRSNGERLGLKKENLGFKEEDEESGIQDTDLADLTTTIPLTERELQKMCARDQEAITMGRLLEG